MEFVKEKSNIKTVSISRKYKKHFRQRVLILIVIVRQWRSPMELLKGVFETIRSTASNTACYLKKKHFKRWLIVITTHPSKPYSSVLLRCDSDRPLTSHKSNGNNRSWSRKKEEGRRRRKRRTRGFQVSELRKVLACSAKLSRCLRFTGQP